MQREYYFSSKRATLSRPIGKSNAHRRTKCVEALAINESPGNGVTRVRRVPRQWVGRPHAFHEVHRAALSLSLAGIDTEYTQKETRKDGARGGGGGYTAGRT